VLQTETEAKAEHSPHQKPAVIFLDKMLYRHITLVALLLLWWQGCAYLKKGVQFARVATTSLPFLMSLLEDNDAMMEEEDVQSEVLGQGDRLRRLPSLWTDRVGVSDSMPMVGKEELKIVSYNVLGPLHGEGSKHEYAPVHVTKWTRRRDKLMDELRSLNADILCLQEVSQKGLKETFIPGLRQVGLECCGFAPSKKSEGSKGKYAHKSVGCAVFSRTNKVDVLQSKRVHLRDFAPLDNCMSHNFHVDVMSKWNAMTMVQCLIKATNQTVIVCNSHLYWNPDRADLKAIQTVSACTALSRFVAELGFDLKCKETTPPVIFCGDLNTSPDMGFDPETGTSVRSAPFAILSEGQLDTSHPQHPDRWSLKLGPDQGPSPRLGALKSEWRFENVYFDKVFQDQQPLFTTKTDDFSGWIDHIFVNERLAVSHVLSGPIVVGDLRANQKARAFGPIPNRFYASDHLPVGVIVSVRS